MQKCFLIISIFLFQLLIVSHANSAVVVDKVAAVVDDKIITLSELEEETNKSNALLEEKLDKRFVLNRLIDEIILRNEASNQGIVVADEELDFAVDQLRRQFNYDDEKMKEELSKENVTVEQLRDQWEIQMLSKRLVESEMKGKIAVTEDEILEYYRANYGEVEYGSEVRIAHILIPRDEPSAYSKSKEVAELAKSGKNFEKLVREYSKDATSIESGGDLGYFNKGDLVYELESAIALTPAGEITGPVETSAGYHIVKVLEKKEKTEASLGGYRDQIRQTIYNQKTQDFLKDWVKERRNGVYVDIKI